MIHLDRLPTSDASLLHLGGMQAQTQVQSRPTPPVSSAGWSAPASAPTSGMHTPIPALTTPPTLMSMVGDGYGDSPLSSSPDQETGEDLEPSTPAKNGNSPPDSVTASPTYAQSLAQDEASAGPSGKSSPLTEPLSLIDEPVTTTSPPQIDSPETTAPVSGSVFPGTRDQSNGGQSLVSQKTGTPPRQSPPTAYGHGQTQAQSQGHVATSSPGAGPSTFKPPSTATMPSRPRMPSQSHSQSQSQLQSGGQTNSTPPSLVATILLLNAEYLK
jgi:hypothetical protein